MARSGDVGRAVAKVAAESVFVGLRAGVVALVREGADLSGSWRPEDVDGAYRQAQRRATRQLAYLAGNAGADDANELTAAFAITADLFSRYGRTNAVELAKFGFDPSRAADALLNRGSKLLKGADRDLCKLVVTTCYEAVLRDLPGRQDAFQRAVLAWHKTAPREVADAVDAHTAAARFLRTQAVKRAYQLQVQTIADARAGGDLLDRDRELAEMNGFARESGSGLLVWVAQSWAGKSALMATFALEHMLDIDVAVHFVDKNNAETRTRDRYRDSIITQLEAYLGEDHLSLAGGEDGRYADLLRRAAQTAIDNGRHFVLLADALNEDDAYHPRGVGSSSIASLLPTDTPHLRVIVSCTDDQRVLADLPPASNRRELQPSEHATPIRQAAEGEIHHAAAGTEPTAATARHIIGYLNAAEEALTPEDLSSLISHAHGAAPVTTESVRRSLATDLARVTVPSSSSKTADARAPLPYGLHDGLTDLIYRIFGREQVIRYVEELRAWADTQSARGWTADTPGYLETGYPALLSATGHAATLGRLALDRARHQWLRQRRGGDDQALNEIISATRMLADNPPRDVGTLIRLAFERDRIQGRSANLPTGLPAVWASIGYTHRAVALARSMPTHNQAAALAEIAWILAEAGHRGEAERVAAEAERVAATITSDDERAKVLTTASWALAAAGNLGQAERVAATITNDHERAEALATIAHVFAEAGDTGQAERVAAEAERMAASITNHYKRARTLAAVAEAVAAAGNASEAERVAGEAERIASEGIASEVEMFSRPLLPNYEWEWALTAIARAWTAAGNTGEAERVAAAITNDYDRAGALAAVARALAEAGDTGEAERVAWGAERVAGTINYGLLRTWTLAAVARVWTAAGNSNEAERVAGEAERVAGTITDPYARARALAAAAPAIAAAGNTGQAERAAGEAERVAGTITDSFHRTRALNAVAEAWTRAGNSGEAERAADETKRSASDAERIAATITNEDQRADELIRVAHELAAAGNAGAAERIASAAERVAANTTNDVVRVEALFAVAQAWAAAGNIAEAERVAAAFTNDDDERAEALAAVGQALAAAGDIAGAERVATAISNDRERARALATIGQAWAAAGNIGEAERVAGEAERVAGAIPYDVVRAEALAAVGQAWAAAGNIAEAERVAAAISNDRERARALATIGQAWAAAGNIGEAERVAGEAERVAAAIPYDVVRAEALATIGQAWAAAGNIGEAERVAGEAERVAAAIPYDVVRAEALAAVAQAWAAAGNIAEAERVAAAITNDRERAEALATIGQAWAAAGDIAGAGRVAAAISNDRERARALATIGQALAAAGDIAAAERIAAVIASDHERAEALTWATREVAGGDTGTAERFAAVITNEFERVRVVRAVARGLAAAGNADDAERVAATLIMAGHRAWALAVAAQAFAAAGKTGDAERIAGAAERVAATIPDEQRAYALAEVAEALAAAGNSGAAERIAAIIPDEQRADALAEVAEALAAAGNTGDAERIACDLLLTDCWQSAVRLLLQIRPRGLTASREDDWLTTKWTSDLIDHGNQQPGVTGPRASSG